MLYRPMLILACLTGVSSLVANIGEWCQSSCSKCGKLKYCRIRIWWLPSSVLYLPTTVQPRIISSRQLFVPPNFYCSGVAENILADVKRNKPATADKRRRQTETEDRERLRRGRSRRDERVDWLTWSFASRTCCNLRTSEPLLFRGDAEQTQYHKSFSHSADCQLKHK